MIRLDMLDTRLTFNSSLYPLYTKRPSHSYVDISMIQISQWIHGILSIFFFLLSLLSLCYPFLINLAPFILIYSPITTITHATLLTSLRIYHLYISRQSLVNGFSRKNSKLGIR